MRYSWIVAGLALAMVFPAVAQDKKKAAKDKPAAPALKSVKQKASYGFGLNIGRSIRQAKLDLDIAALARGIAHAAAGDKPLLTDEEISVVMREFQRQMDAQQAAQKKLLAEKNKKAGAAFLAANAKKPGVKTTKSGLQYLVLKPGTGPSPKLTDTVTTHYRGTLIDGTMFDSSYKGKVPAATDRPASFPVNGVIKGWTEALQLMKVGAKWRLFIPSELAYRERGSGQKIGPNSTLIFELELLGIKSGKKPKR